MSKAVAFLAIFWHSISFAYDVGDTVVVIHDANLKVEGKTGDKVWPGLSLQVTAVNGTWLWVSHGHPGWLESEHVVALDQAIPVLTELIRKHPRNAGFYSGRAMVWKTREEYDIAIADYNEAIRLDPSSNYFMNRGSAWGKKRDNDKAIADYNEAIRLDPQNVKCYYNRGNAFGRTKEYDKAISDYSEAIRLDSRFVSPYVGRGYAWRKKKEYDIAILDLNQAITLDQKSSGAYDVRARVWLGKKEFEKAIADCEVVARLDPKSGQSDNAFGWCYAACPLDKYRDGKKAVEYATTACQKSNWKDADHIETLAAAYAESGDFEKAVEWQKKAIELGPKEFMTEMEAHLELYKMGKPLREE